MKRFLLLLCCITSTTILNLDSAVQDAKAMQGLESESLLMEGEHSQKVKAPPIKSDSGSRDCVALSSSTAESRLSASPFIIGIAGGTGSGKTTLSQRLQSTLGIKVMLIEQDCYYKDLSHLPLEERKVINFDHPDSIDFDRLYDDICRLKQGKGIDKPIYSFKTYCREEGSTPLSGGDVVIVEGILSLADERLRNLFDLKIFVETPDDVRILRRIERDINERGRNVSSVINQYLNTVKPMHTLYVAPCMSYADVIIPGESDTSRVVKLILAGLHQLTFDRQMACE